MIAELLFELGQIVFVRDSAGVLSVEGSAPAWVHELWPTAASTRILVPERDSPFLQNFLLDAVAFWETEVSGRVESGTWSERSTQGAVYALCGTAVRVGTQSVLVVEALPLGGPNLGRWRQPIREVSHLADRLANTEASLRSTRAAIEAVNRAKSSFLSHISHEIRTPLNGVLGSLELLEFSTLTSEQRGLLETAQSSAEDLLSVVSDLLDHSKIEAGRLELRREDFRLRAELDLLLRPLLVRAQRRGLRLTRQVAAEVPDSVHGDVGRLCQVLQNLVGNALKYTSQGSVHVAIDAPQLPGPSHPGLELRVKVTDTGVGIEPRKLEHLFHPSGLGDNGLQRRYGGTKLGIAVCQRLVASMGGTIEATSRLGEGSDFIFTIRLELARNPATNPPPLNPPVDPSGILEAPPQPSSVRPKEVGGAPVVPPPPPPPPPKLKVLVVDDHPVNRQLAAAFLEKLGHPPPTFAVDGREALHQIMHEEYDLVLMDLQMPELDGVAATTELRRREDAAGAPRLPVIAFTAHVRPDDHVACLAAGMDGFLTKPLRYAALAETLETVLKAKATASVPSPNAAPAQAWSGPAAAATSEPSLAPALLELLRTSTSSGLADLDAAIARVDAPAAGRAAHFLKGGLALLYDSELIRTAEALETATGAGDWAAARRLAQALSERVAQVL